VQFDRHELKLDRVPGTVSAAISVHRGGGQTDRGDKRLSTFVHDFVHTSATKVELPNVADMPPATFHRALGHLLKSGDLIKRRHREASVLQGGCVVNLSTLSTFVHLPAESVHPPTEPPR
jgi:hypothetical protein